MNEQTMDNASTAAITTIASADQSTAEEWRPVLGYEKLYDVSSCGRMRNKRTGYLLRAQRCTNGYLMVFLYRPDSVTGKAVARHVLIHRAVAEAFIPNPEKKEYVDHINTVRDDNCVSNLRWCTLVENHRNPITYARQCSSKRERAKTSDFREKISQGHDYHKKLVRCIETGLVYPSIHEAARRHHITKQCVKQACDRAVTNKRLFSNYRGHNIFHFEWYTQKQLSELRD